MVLATLYLGDKKDHGFFNIPSDKKSNFVVREQKEKTLADKILDKVNLDFKKDDAKKSEK